MVITFISDTHGKHEQLELEGGDILIHAGDVEARNEWDLKDFCEWFDNQNYKYKVFVAGNHDFYLQRPDCRDIIDNYDVIYIKDFQIEIENIKIWGSPWSLPFYNWAFMRSDEVLDGIYSIIPENTDILINHGAPRNILDTFDGNITGSKSLAYHAKRVKPKYCVFGHIHECYGRTQQDGIQYINASVLDEKYKLVNDPITINYA